MTQTRVLQIVNIAAQVQKGKSPTLQVEALGITANAGWAEFKLLPTEKKVGADGILDLELVGTQPKSKITTPPEFPISASIIWTDGVEGIVGVRIVARTNEQTMLLSQYSRGRSTLRTAQTHFSAGVKPPETDTEEPDEPPTLLEEPPTFLEHEPSYGIEGLPTGEKNEQLPTFAEEFPTIGEESPTVGEGPPIYPLPPRDPDTPPWEINPPPKLPQPSNPWGENIFNRPPRVPSQPAPWPPIIWPDPQVGNTFKDGYWTLTDKGWGYVPYKYTSQNSAFGRR